MPRPRTTLRMRGIVNKLSGKGDKVSNWRNCGSGKTYGGSGGYPTLGENPRRERTYSRPEKRCGRKCYEKCDGGWWRDGADADHGAVAAGDDTGAAEEHER